MLRRFYRYIYSPYIFIAVSALLYQHTVYFPKQAYIFYYEPEFKHSIAFLIYNGLIAHFFDYTQYLDFIMKHTVLVSYSSIFLHGFNTFLSLSILEKIAYCWKFNFNLTKAFMCSLLFMSLPIFINTILDPHSILLLTCIALSLLSLYYFLSGKVNYLYWSILTLSFFSTFSLFMLIVSLFTLFFIRPISINKAIFFLLPLFAFAIYSFKINSTLSILYFRFYTNLDLIREIAHQIFFEIIPSSPIYYFGWKTTTLIILLSLIHLKNKPPFAIWIYLYLFFVASTFLSIMIIQGNNGNFGLNHFVYYLFTPLIFLGYIYLQKINIKILFTLLLIIIILNFHKTIYWKSYWDKEAVENILRNYKHERNIAKIEYDMELLKVLQHRQQIYDILNWTEAKASYSFGLYNLENSISK